VKSSLSGNTSKDVAQNNNTNKIINTMVKNTCTNNTVRK
jgi:hypothetical protein